MAPPLCRDSPHQWGPSRRRTGWDLPARPRPSPVKSAPQQRGSGSSVTAAVGNAPAIGSLSAPPSWTAPSSPLGSVLSTLPGAGAVAAPSAEGPASMLGGMPLSGLSSRGFGETPRYGFRPNVVIHPPAAG
ncbi:MAG: hypothetical protein K2X97_16315 [Mycobacteriaceae bacterium]|nr:hypothetical protein [Mycobacteriaceae bacterium]